jgi:hypothetical protein
MKWVIDYNTHNIEHLTFILNGEKTWVHYFVCPNVDVMLSMTQVTFALVMYLVKIQCKCKFLACSNFLKFIDALKF